MEGISQENLVETLGRILRICEEILAEFPKYFLELSMEEVLKKSITVIPEEIFESLKQSRAIKTSP